MGGGDSKPCDELIKLEVDADGTVTGLVDDGDGIFDEDDGKLVRLAAAR